MVCWGRNFTQLSFDYVGYVVLLMVCLNGVKNPENFQVMIWISDKIAIFLDEELHKMHHQIVIL